MSIEIKGYITNLGKYNEGYLIGKWIEFPIDEDELQEVLMDIGINSHYEEYFFTDWDITGLNELDLDEYEDIEAVNNFCKALEKSDKYDERKLAAVMEYEGARSIEDAQYLLDNLDSWGFYDGADVEEMADEYADEILSELPDTPAGKFARNHFDYESHRRDYKYGYYQASTGVLYTG